MFSSSTVDMLRDQEDGDGRDYTNYELLATNTTRGVQYGWDYSTNGGHDVDAQVETIDEEDDIVVYDKEDISVQLVEETCEEMITDGTKDAEAMEAAQHNEDLYPPPPAEIHKCQRAWKEGKAQVVKRHYKISKTLWESLGCMDIDYTIE